MKATRKQQPSCACGCGKKTSGSSFKQGHDAKLKSLALRVLNKEAPASKLTAAARAYLATHNTGAWARFHDLVKES